MNLQHLEYLIEIENCGSISKAARRLFVTQPYLSRILKEVESEYGITVFTREKDRYHPHRQRTAVPGYGQGTC